MFFQSLDSLVAPLEIIALVDCFAMKIHTVIDDVEMRMLGLKMTHDKVLCVLLNPIPSRYSFGELCHEFIGKTGSIGIVKTDGDMSRRVLLTGHKSVYRPQSRTISGADAIILNSVVNVNKAVPYLNGYADINCYLDNDTAGRTSLAELTAIYGSTYD